MRVKVDAVVSVPKKVWEIITIDDAEYMEWLDEAGATPSDGMLMEFLKAGTGAEFKNPLMVRALPEYGDDRITKVEVL